MKTFAVLSLALVAFGCTLEPSLRAIDNRRVAVEVAPDEEDAGAAEPAEMPTDVPDAQAPVDVAPPDADVVADAGVPATDAEVVADPDAASVDAGATDAGTAGDAAVERDAASDAGDAGTTADAGPTRVDAGSTRDGALRRLSLHMTGMEDDLRHFAQFRVANAQREFHIMFVIHEGLTSGTYAWDLPNALVPGEAYTLDFFVDHDESTGPGFFDSPPRDHAWSIAIPAGEGDVDIDFAYNEEFVDIEDIAPTPFRSTYLTSSGMEAYRGLLYDVRLIERSTGRLVGRQLREIPGDSFELTVGSTTREGVEYQIDVAVDADNSGDYNYPTDPSWRLLATGTDSGLRPTLDSSAPQVDVGF